LLRGEAALKAIQEAEMPMSLRALPMPLRVLFTCFLLMLGLGYLTAMGYLFLVDVEPHASKGQGLVEGIAEKYHGKPTLLEIALQGAMSDRIGGPDKRLILQWVRAGARADDFPTIKPILEANCIGCHNANSNVRKKTGGPVPSFESYEGISALADVDTGPTIAQLAKVSHVHLFGISIIFLLTGFIFAQSETPSWFRVGLIVTPYAAILADIGSWWLTKWDTFFAVVVIVGGALMGLALACQILISLWEMWLAGPDSRWLARERAAVAAR
jgi:hypothetical protein